MIDLKHRCQIVIQNGDVCESTYAESLESQAHSIWWTGLVYDDQGRLGSAVMTWVADELAKGTPIQDLARGLRGFFFCAIVDRVRASTYAFVDDSGLFCAYRSDTGASTSFMGLCKSSQIKSQSFDRQAVLELLHLGNVYFGDTLSPQIRKIASNEVVVFSESSTEVLQKSIPRLSDEPRFSSLLDATQSLAQALAGQTISVDITGGFDSRMMVCLLFAHGVSFETALSGSAGTADAVIGSQVAESLGVPYFFSTYDGSGLVDRLKPLLRRLDGMGGPIQVVDRLCQFQEDRSARGISIALKGSGGELYKDFFWTQDFPFYRSGKSRFERLHRMRMEFELLDSNVLTAEAVDSFRRARSKRVERLAERYQMPINTQSYDNVYFYERVQTWNSRTVTSVQYPEISTHCPLAELNVAQLGFHAPRRLRFYNGVHRREITSISPRVASVRTTDGTSASSRPWEMMVDGIGFAKVKGKKLAKKLSQLLFNRTRFEAAEYRPSSDGLRAIAQSAEAVESITALKEFGLLRPQVTLEDLSPRFQEHAVSAGWVISELQ